MKILAARRWGRLLEALVVVSFVLVFPAIGAETIYSMSANITVLADGSVDVSETIEVRAEGTRIKRGIFRDIPTVLRNDDGSLLRSNLTVISVSRDGEPEPFFTKSITNGTRIYVGDANVYLSPGRYSYTIRYTMTRMARFFDDYDEIYWNATGNFWDFPIEQAVAQITLPDGANITGIAAYTGPQGSTDSDAKTSITSNNTAIFRSTRVLSPGEGMTVSLLFEKGALVEPGGVQKGLDYLADRRDTIFPLIAVFVVFIYYYFAWNAVGRDPKKGVIIPLFYPPKGFSPALTHYVHRMGWRKNAWTAFSAALVSLGVKGLLTISKEGKKVKKTVLTSVGKASEPLPSGETLIQDYLVKKGQVKINRSSGPALNKTRMKFKKAIETENQRAYFVNNPGYLVAGFVLSAVAVLALSLVGVLEIAAAFSIIIMGVVVGVFASVLGKSWTGGGFARYAIMAWVGVVALNFLGALARIFSNAFYDPAIVGVLSIVVINLIFVGLLRAPTVQGRKVMDKIDGFKLYLETAEKERLNFQKEPEFSVKRFERFLPYAIALGVEKPWSERLEGELARNTLPDSQGGYHPVWYHGGDFGTSSIGKDMAGIASGVSAAMMAAQPSSSSSSGGGGGGSSGGGGGGGGGGGW